MTKQTFISNLPMVDAPASASQKACCSVCRGVVDGGNNGLQQMMMPAGIRGVSLSEGALACGTVHHKLAGRMLFYVAEGQLYVVYIDHPDRDAERLCAISMTSVTDARVAMITMRRAVVTLYDEASKNTRTIDINVDIYGNCRTAASERDFPQLAFSVEGEGILNTTVAARRLSGEYTTRSSVLDATDAQRLNTDLLAAYSRLWGMARTAGLVMQPMLARYRIVDDEGQSLFISDPVEVAPTGRFQGLEEHSAAIDPAMQTRGEMTIGVRAGRLTLSGDLTGTNETRRAQAARLIIELTHAAHCVDFAAQAPHVINTDGAAARLRCLLPGVSGNMVASTANGERRLSLMSEAGDKAWRTVAVIDKPFAAQNSGNGNVTGTLFNVYVDACRGSRADLAKDLAAVDALAPAADAAVTKVGNLMNVDAAVSARMGDSIVWGALKGEGVDAPGAIAIAPATDCRRITALTDLTPTGRVVALSEIDRRGGAWSYSLRRLYAMTTDGTFVADVTRSGEWGNLHRHDIRPVKSGRHVAQTTHPRYAAMMLAGGDIMGLTRSGSEILFTGIEAEEVAWDAANQALWLRSADGRCRMAVISDSRRPLGIAELPRSFRARQLVAYSEGLLIIDNNGNILDTALPPDVDRAEIALGWRIPIVPDTNARQLRVEFDMLASDFEGTLTMRSGGAGLPQGEEFTLATLAVNGRINAPLRILTTLPPGAVHISLNLSGIASQAHIRALNIATGNIAT